MIAKGVSGLASWLQLGWCPAATPLGQPQFKAFQTERRPNQTAEGASPARSQETVLVNSYEEGRELSLLADNERDFDEAMMGANEEDVFGWSEDDCSTYPSVPFNALQQPAIESNQPQTEIETNSNPVGTNSNSTFRPTPPVIADQRPPHHNDGEAVDPLTEWRLAVPRWKAVDLIKLMFVGQSPLRPARLLDPACLARFPRGTPPEETVMAGLLVRLAGPVAPPLPRPPRLGSRRPLRCDGRRL